MWVGNSGYGYWESGTEWIAKEGRPAHLYVFAHHGVFGDHADHRDPAQWEFYVVPTSALPDVKQISLSRIRPMSAGVSMANLAATVRKVVHAIAGEAGDNLR